MQLYAILRRSGWDSATDLEEAGQRSARVGNEEMPDRVRWIRSYALEEENGKVGTVCIYEAESPEAIREHAARAATAAALARTTRSRRGVIASVSRIIPARTRR